MSKFDEGLAIGYILGTKRAPKDPNLNYIYRTFPKKLTYAKITTAQDLTRSMTSTLTVSSSYTIT